MLGEGRTAGRIRICAEDSGSAENNLGQEIAQGKAWRAKLWQKEELILSRRESLASQKGCGDRGRKAGTSMRKTRKAR